MVPAVSPVMVLLVPLPDVVILPGVLVSIHVPVAGNPFKRTLPVVMVPVGCVIVPTLGAVGAEGWGLITILADNAEIHPVSLVTL